MTSLAYNSHSHSHSHSHRYSSNRNHHGLHRPPHLLMTTTATSAATTTTATTTVMHPCSPAGGAATVRRRPFISTNLCISTLIISSLTSWLFLSVAFLSGQEEQQRRHRGSRLLQSSPASSAVASWEDLDTHQYSYTQYLIDFPGKIISSREEFVRRREIFEENLAFIYHFNQHKRGYSLGVNDFLDRFPEELPQPGYDKQQHEAWNGRTNDAGLGTEQTHTRMVQTSSEYQTEFMSMIDELTDAVDLPKHVDWRIDSNTGRPLATPVKSQGHCGSCWAFASTAALESHIALTSKGQTLTSLSVQELVSCAPNTNHCGGSGGCSGSTAEIAYEFIAKHGLVDEWTFGYQNYANSRTVGCTLRRTSDNPFYDRAVVTVEGFVKLPSNNYTALMNAVAKLGPVVVNVAADNWHFYEKGVFKDHGHSVARTDVNHVVVLMGYGTDTETGEDYWLVRNSYGLFWGEGGYIRLKRTDPSTLPQPDADCGMDVTPADGIACSKKYGHDIRPPAVKVCGTSGVLFDPLLPVGARLLKQQQQQQKQQQL